MATFNKDNNTYSVTDVKAELRSITTVVNQLTLQLKDRNLVGDKRKEVLKARKESLKNALYLTSAGIVNNVLEADSYGLLKAQATSKTFKEVADINDILSELMAELAKERIEGSEYSITELAKLIETPSQYQPLEGQEPVVIGENGVPEVPEVNGNTVVSVETVEGTSSVVDKTTGTMYTAENEGEHPSTTNGGVKISKLGAIKDTVVNATVGAYTWSKNAVITAFGFAWNAVVLAASFILVAIMTAGSYIYMGVAKSTSWVIGLFGKSKPTKVIPAGAQPATEEKTVEPTEVIQPV